MAWERMIACEDLDEKNHLIDQLRAYYHQDTLGMVKMHNLFIFRANSKSIR